MKYFEVDFVIQTLPGMLQDARDIVSAFAGEAGFETFTDTENGLKGYVQQAVLDEPLLRQLLDELPMQDTTVSYTIAEAEDRDWNEQWEQEGFEPIVVDCENGCTVIVHDGRHLPQQLSEPADNVLTIEIDAHLAFGTGTHETTRMMIASLMKLPLRNKRVLDCGCGTGILGIAALKGGAEACTGYDIDEWSADNARHNAVINCVDNRFTSLLGDASILSDLDEQFDIVLANINRNILLADLPAFRSKMNPGATLLLSGFYEGDIAMLSSAAQAQGLTLLQQTVDNEWACLMFQLGA